MSIIEILITAVALSADAFAVSVSKGLSAGKVQARHCLICAAWFGGFQALMPAVGMIVGNGLSRIIASGAHHWIAFGLLAYVGASMIISAIRNKKEEESSSFAPGKMLVLAIATSIDALAVGFAFSMKSLPPFAVIYYPLIIGAVTFGLSYIGVLAGNKLGERHKRIAQAAGGIILLLIGVKSLLEGFHIIDF